MLSEREARSLREIEQHLTQDDMRFAALMNRPVFDRRERRTRWAYDTVVVLAALAAVLCMVLAGSGTFGAGMAAMGFAVVTAYVRVRRFPLHRKPRVRRPR